MQNNNIANITRARGVNFIHMIVGFHKLFC